MRPTIEQIRQVADFATVYHWYFSIDKYPAVGDLPEGTELNLRCATSALPKSTINATEVNIRGHKIKQPGIMTYENTLTINFLETVDNIVSTFIREWREICYESITGAQNTKADVEAIIKLVRLDRTDTPIWEYVLHGCYLESYDYGGELSDTASDAFRLAITISYDYFVDSELV
jgi:hypothetical protein